MHTCQIQIVQLHTNDDGNISAAICLAANSTNLGVEQELKDEFLIPTTDMWASL